MLRLRLVLIKLLKVAIGVVVIHYGIQVLGEGIEWLNWHSVSRARVYLHGTYLRALEGVLIAVWGMAVLLGNV